MKTAPIITDAQTIKTAYTRFGYTIPVLTDSAHSFGSFDLYIGDDGKIHGS